MIARKLKEFLNQNQVKYVTITHSPAYTAQEVAASAHVAGRHMAKTVIIHLAGRLAMAVLPANRKIILQDLLNLTGSEDVRFATESEFASRFPDCEVGAMPPFGNLYGMDVYVAPALAEDGRLAFNAGSHTEIIELAYTDFARLVNPKLMMFTT